MRIRITLVAALVGVIVLTGALVPSPLARAADTEPIAPLGALAHATRALEQDTNGKILEIRLTDEAGAAAFEAAIADAMTGAFIANPDELYEPHTPVDLARRLAL
jgi:hypothetical protein